MIEQFEPILEKMVEIQNKYPDQVNGFTQNLQASVAVKTSLEELLGSKFTIMQNLMKGMSAKLDVSLVKKIDDIILDIFKFGEG